jgi:hypothetical protein
MVSDIKACQRNSVRHRSLLAQRGIKPEAIPITIPYYHCYLLDHLWASCDDLQRYIPDVVLTFAFEKKSSPILKRCFAKPSVTSLGLGASFFTSEISNPPLKSFYTVSLAKVEQNSKMPSWLFLISWTFPLKATTVFSMRKSVSETSVAYFPQLSR